MGAKQSRSRTPYSPHIRFRVLIIGRANSGKTTILKKVCDTTESPTIYRDSDYRREEVRHSGLVVLPVSSYATQVTLDPSMEVSDKRCRRLSLLTLNQPGEHDIDDELVFSNHTGYVFHDSRGIESGSTEEVDILREFIGRKANAKQLLARLHVIWFGLFKLCVNDDDK